MKIIDGPAFLHLPAGTLFVVWDHGGRSSHLDCGTLRMKHQTSGNSWVEADLAGIGALDCTSSEQMHDRIEMMFAGREFPALPEECTTRAGLHDYADDQLFLVLDRADVQALVNCIATHTGVRPC